MNTEMMTGEWETRLGDQVRALRIAAGIDQRELAARANVSTKTLGALERGDGSNLTTLVRVVRVLGREQWLTELDPRGDGPSPIEMLREQRRQSARPHRVSRSR